MAGQTATGSQVKVNLKKTKLPPDQQTLGQLPL